MVKNRMNLQLFASNGGKSASSRGTTPTVRLESWDEAFTPTTKSRFEGDNEWKDFADSFGHKVSDEERKLIMKEWDSRTDEVYGYVQTSNSFRINEKLYDPANAGKSDEEIFTRKDRNGELRDLQTVRTLDKKIQEGRTPRDAVYTRFTEMDAMKATFGLDSETSDLLLKAASKLTWSRSSDAISEGLKARLNDAFKGSKGFSNSYTSTSASRDMNVFSDKVFERKLYVPGGTHAFAARDNRVESEIVFGRRMETEVFKVTVEGGHIVFHERFVGYRKRSKK